MLIAVSIALMLLAAADIFSGVFITRTIEKLTAELFAAIEEQRQALRQLRKTKAELKTAATRRELAQRQCEEQREKLSRVQARLHALAERADKQKAVRVRGQRPG